MIADSVITTKSASNKSFTFRFEGNIIFNVGILRPAKSKFLFSGNVVSAIKRTLPETFKDFNEAVNNFVENDLDILRFDSSILSDIKVAYIADMKKHVETKAESIKIEAVYNNIPEQLAKENKNFQYTLLEKNARGRKYRSPINWLISAKLILMANNIKRVEKPLKIYKDNSTFKLYLSDVGLLSNASEVTYREIINDEDFIFKGAITENYVAQELASYTNSLYFWLSNGEAEVNFLLSTPNDGIIPIEVKSGINNKSKSLNVYVEQNHPKYSIRFSTRNFGFENNIKSIPLYAVFCLNNKNI